MAKTTDCSNCGNLLDEEEVDNPNIDPHGDILCDQCYDDKYREVCPICEDSYEKPTTPEETFFVLSTESAKQMEIEGGIYRVKRYPYYRANIVTGFETLYEENVELMRKVDINSILRHLQSYRKKQIAGDEICPDCAKHYSRTNNFHQINVQYIDEVYRLHRNIFERGVIQNGF